MPGRDQITSIRFKNYKAFRDYSVSLSGFNVLVGPNNAGKSTILGAIRILSEGLRKARARSSTLVTGPQGQTSGYHIELSGLPISTENVFFNYNDREPAIITFRISESHQLILFFPEKGSCSLIPVASKYIRSPADFRKHFDIKVAFVPVLGPVDHNERLYKSEAARLALLSHGASRNFRNIWYHFRDGFHDFREMVRTTWPGMDIELPESLTKARNLNYACFVRKNDSLEKSTGPALGFRCGVKC